MFYLSTAATVDFETSNTQEMNHERVRIWIKQLGEGRFTLYGLLIAQLVEEEGKIAPDDRRQLNIVLLNGGTQIARLLAEEGQWFAVRRTALEKLGRLMRDALNRIDTIFAGYVAQMATKVPSLPVTLVRDEARAFIVLAMKTKGMIQAVTFIRKDIHPFRQLQSPPRLLTWTYIYDQASGGPAIQLGDAMNVAINAQIVYTWGDFQPPIIRIRMLKRLVDLYGSPLQKEALATVVAYRKLNDQFMRDWMKTPIQGPGAIDLTSRVDDAMLKGAERRSKRRRRVIRYTRGISRDAATDAETAKRMAQAHPLFHRATVFNELRANSFAIEELGYMSSGDASRGILLAPKKTDSWAALAASNEAGGVLLTIDAEALVGLGYYTLAEYPIQMKIKEEQEGWMERMRVIYAEERDMAEDDADALVSELWRKNSDDEDWISSSLNVAYFIFYDGVPYSSYLAAIRTVTFWDKQGQRHTEDYSALSLNILTNDLQSMRL